MQTAGAVRDEADCRPQLCDAVTLQLWARTFKELSSAVEQHLRLPTVYIGIGQGALPAAQLAAVTHAQPL